jgi:Rha family phage regulatory protein
MKALSKKAPVTPDPVVHVYRRKVTTSSLAVAEYFGKKHKTVLRAIQNIHDKEFSRHNFVPRDYIDQRGKRQPAYEMTFDGFALLAMGFTGKTAEEFKIRYINAFNRMLDDLPADREEAIQAKRAAHIGMADAVKLTKEHDGKEAKPYHFMNENLLCNEVAFGIRKGIDETTLTGPETKLLERVRNYNEILIRDNIPYPVRKGKLAAYADIQRRYLMPALRLVGGAS